MTIRGRRRVGLLFGAVVLLASGRLSAATVEIEVVERGGGPVPEQPVALYPVTPDIQADPLFFFNNRAAGRCTTGDTGRCSISDLHAGVYVPYLAWIADHRLAAPIGAPIVAYGTVTVRTSDAKAPLKIELQRGVRVQLRVVSERAPLPQRSRVELASDSGENTNAPLDAGGKAQITLGSGRWVAHLAGPPGARIVGVELDGNDLAAPDVPIELVAPSSDRFITWTLSAPCSVRGTVTSTRKPPTVSVGATLVTAGPWGASPLCRATNCAGAPSAQVLPNGNFTMEVPSGTWRIGPSGDSLLESTPPAIDVTCGEGESARADFNVRETELGDRSKVVLVVAVVGPDLWAVPEVLVDVWPPTGNLENSAALATKVTGLLWPPAAFTELAAGSYLIRARKPGYLNAVLSVSDLDPEEREPRNVTFYLAKGATIDALVKDEQDRPVKGVGLTVKRIDPPPPPDDPVARLAEAERELSVPPGNDQTGHVAVTGLAGGTYDVTPVLSGTIASASAATIAAGAAPGETNVVVRLADHEVKELLVRVRSAPFLAGRLVCLDAGLLPRQGDTCVLGLPAADEDDAMREACAKPVITPGPIEFSGERRDAFRVGPLKPGSYRLGLRPRGYSSWTWALGTSDGTQAAIVQINGNDPAELGTIPVYCGPAVAVRPTVLSHDSPPDLTFARVEAELTRKGTDGTVERQVVTAEKDRERVAFRELPEGEWTLDVTISHPFFMPAAPVHLSLPVKLERGRLVSATVEIASVGGAVVIEASSGAARLTSPDGAARVVAAKSGSIAIEGVAPGTHVVELCEDPSCARVVRRWDSVRVDRGHKVVLTTAP
jgi:hypothetical protein